MDKDLPENWDLTVANYNINILNWIRTRAIAELLIEKGIITSEEYNNKLDITIKRDQQNLIDFLFLGKKEPPNIWNQKTKDK